MSTDDWLDLDSATGSVDLYDGDHRACFIGPTGADWVYRIDRADTVPGGFARWADTMHDGYRMGHDRVPAKDLPLRQAVATHRRDGTFRVIGPDGQPIATGAARIFLGDQ